ARLGQKVHCLTEHSSASCFFAFAVFPATAIELNFFGVAPTTVIYRFDLPAETMASAIHNCASAGSIDNPKHHSSFVSLNLPGSPNKLRTFQILKVRKPESSTLLWLPLPRFLCGTL